MSRTRAFRVSPEFLVQMCKQGEQHFTVVNHALPDDAKYVGIEWNVDVHAFQILVESASFDDVPDDQTREILPATEFQKLDAPRVDFPVGRTKLNGPLEIHGNVVIGGLKVGRKS